MVCEVCGAEFEYNGAEDFFEDEYPGLPYQNFRKCLCGDCAVQAINDQEEGVYFEICEKCGNSFDLIEDSANFNQYSRCDGIELMDVWEEKILCCRCALERIEEDNE